MLSTREQNSRLRCLLALGLMLPPLVFWGCDKPAPKAQFQTCERVVPRRDIVFIVDQSGTMSANDPQALRWEVLRVVSEFLFRDENLPAAQWRENSAETLRTQIAIIPFGNEERTQAYNANLHWFSHNQMGDLSALLHHWRKRTLHGDTANFSNFSLPFRLLAANRLRWRQDAARFIFFISDGNYNVLPHINNPANQRHEELRFKNLLTELGHHKDWPVYFIGLGVPGLNRNKEPKVATYRLMRMAQALPLPTPPNQLTTYPSFTAPGLLQRNVVSIITSDTEEMRAQLQRQLEQVLRPVRSASTALTRSGSTFPLINPGWAEVTVEVARETTTAALVQNLRFFVKPANSYKVMREFKPLPAYPATALYSSFLHTLVVDTAALRRELPEALHWEKLATWGLKSLPPGNIVVRRVGLAIKDNWKVTIDRCEIARQPLQRSWWRRLLRQREPPKYQLSLTVRAAHPCQVTLPQAQLRVRIPEIGQWKIMGAPTADAEGTTYVWHFTLAHQKLFAERIGGELTLALEISALPASHLELPAKIPVHARVVTNALWTNVLPSQTLAY